MNTKKPASNSPKGLGMLIVCIFLLSAIPKNTIRQVWFALLRRPEVLMDRPQELAYFLGFVVVLIVMVIAVITFLASILKRKPVGREKPNPSARQDQAKASTMQTLAAHIRQDKRSIGDEAIHCAHLTGREKYLEQINSFLKNGLIDRAEYNALRERYSKLNIPDDYHG